MLEFLFKHIFSHISWLDILDILIVYYIVYRLLLFIKGTRAVQMLTGLLFISLIYVSSMWLGLLTLHELLSRFFNYLFIIIIVLFQEDIRKALTNFGKTPFFGRMVSKEETEDLVEEIVKSCVTLARKKIGALIVFERETGLKDFIEVGIKMDSKVNAELLISIFTPTSPIHDGAVIVSLGRINGAGCFLPLTRNPQIEKTLGTRHRAALGLTEETDSVVVVVSEEHREISLAINGELIRGLDGPTLRRRLNSELGLKGVISA